jgi:hypothetical protein
MNHKPRIELNTAVFIPNTSGRLSNIINLSYLGNNVNDKWHQSAVDYGLYLVDIASRNV